MSFRLEIGLKPHVLKGSPANAITQRAPKFHDFLCAREENQITLDEKSYVDILYIFRAISSCCQWFRRNYRIIENMSRTCFIFAMFSSLHLGHSFKSRSMSPGFWKQIGHFKLIYRPHRYRIFWYWPRIASQLPEWTRPAEPFGCEGPQHVTRVSNQTNALRMWSTPVTYNIRWTKDSRTATSTATEAYIQLQRNGISFFQ